MAMDSKKRLFKTARHLFAQKGYQATSTRDIAEKAKVNISSITYYFGSKLGLYKAVLSDIANRVKKELNEKTNNALNLLTDQETSADWTVHERIFSGSVKDMRVSGRCMETSHNTD